MIKFFRKIRYQLLGEGKTGKYLKYAIGEIVLVVIGILIALSINNWNEIQKIIKSENVYLKKVYQDIAVMAEYYQSDYSKFPEDIDEALKALQFAESCGEMLENEDAFLSTLRSHQKMSMYMQSRSTYDEMISNGAFSRLQNLNIKNTIENLYSTLDFANSQITYYRDEVGRASAIINKHVLFSYNSDGNLLSTYTISNICNNIEFKNALVEIVDARQDWLWGYYRILKPIIEAKALIENELND